MSKKDYEAFAAILAASSTVADVRISLAVYCKQENPRFDIGKFIAAASQPIR